MTAKKKIQKIGVVTSGGDAPGLNAAIHAIVVAAYKKGIQVTGIHEGYEGLINGHFSHLDIHQVRNIMDEGGTILRTSRSERFKEAKWRKLAAEKLAQADVDALIVIGGNGSLAGTDEFSEELNIPLIGIPKTIDNDCPGTDFAIGFDTATNTIVEAIDKIKDTADATSRIFIVEVMGRKSGYLAIHSGIAVGADAIIIPEVKPDLKKLVAYVKQNRRIGNRSMIIVITENSIPNGALGLKQILDEKLPQYESRVCILGHMQRGGRPSAFDRTLASLLGYEAFAAVVKGKTGMMVGMVKGKIKFTPFSELRGKPHPIEPELLLLADRFSFL